MTDRQFWTLRLSEPLASRNGDLPAGLCSDTDEASEVLAEGWGISSGEEMVSILEWLRDEGHREAFQAQHDAASSNSFLAWDLARMAQLVRWGVRAGYLKVESAWRWLEIVGDHAAAGFQDWASYLDDYEAGYLAWAGDDAEAEAEVVAGHVSRLKAEKLPQWDPLKEPPLSPLKHRFRSFRLKTSLSATFRSVLLLLLVIVVAAVKPWPLGAAILGALLLALGAKKILWGPLVGALIGLMGIMFAGSSFVLGFFRDAVPESWEMALASILFAFLTFYTAAYFLAYSDDRTPAAQ